MWFASWLASIKCLFPYIIIKMTKFQEIERILKAAKEKQEVTYKGAPTRPAADFSRETLQARRDWQEIFQVMES